MKAEGRTAVAGPSRRRANSTGGLLARITLGLVATCGIACALPLLLAALGLSGAAVLAASRHEFDEWLFCSPFGAWVLAALVPGSLFLLGRHVYRSRQQARGCCGESGTMSPDP